MNLRVVGFGRGGRGGGKGEGKGTVRCNRTRRELRLGVGRGWMYLLLREYAIVERSCQHDTTTGYH